MARPDLNLLVALEVLLSEMNVARAAQRLRLSPSAMSRTLARLRAATGDPLLVRAGRKLVATPHASALRASIGATVEQAEALLRPAASFEPRDAVRTFTLRASDGFVETFGPRLLARLEAEAPGISLRFVPKTDRESGLLREGRVDLETGVVGQSMGPEIRAQQLFRDRWIGAVRRGHPLGKGKVLAERFAGGRHILVSRRGEDRGPVDDALDALGLRRKIATVVAGFSAALLLARGTDLIATVPELHTAGLRGDLQIFRLPVKLPELPISLLWHPRLDADPVHRWLRECIKECVRPR